jgi:hypothetical protein
MLWEECRESASKLAGLNVIETGVSEDQLLAQSFRHTLAQGPPTDQERGFWRWDKTKLHTFYSILNPFTLALVSYLLKLRMAYHSKWAHAGLTLSSNFIKSFSVNGYRYFQLTKKGFPLPVFKMSCFYDIMNITLCVSYCNSERESISVGSGCKNEIF